MAEKSALILCLHLCGKYLFTTNKECSIFLRFSINFEADDNFFVVAVNFKSDLAY